MHLCRKSSTALAGAFARLGSPVDAARGALLPRTTSIFSARASGAVVLIAVQDTVRLLTSTPIPMRDTILGNDPRSSRSRSSWHVRRSPRGVADRRAQFDDRPRRRGSVHLQQRPPELGHPHPPIRRLGRHPRSRQPTPTAPPTRLPRHRRLRGRPGHRWRVGLTSSTSPPLDTDGDSARPSTRSIFSARGRSSWITTSFSGVDFTSIDTL